MNALGSILSSLASGAANKYVEKDEEARKRKRETDDLISNTLIQASAGDEVTPEQAMKMVEEGLRRRGVDEKSIQKILDASGHIQRAALEAQHSQAQPGFTPGGQLPAMPGMDASLQLPGFPEMPQRTQGDIKTEKATKLAEDKLRRDTQAQIFQKSEIDKAELENWKNNVEGMLGRPLTEEEVQTHFGLAPRAAATTSAFVPGTKVDGTYLIELLKAQGSDYSDVHPDQQYTLSVGPDRHTIVGHWPAAQSRYQGPKAAGYNYIKQFATDLLGNPIIGPKMYVPIMSRTSSNILGIVPEDEFDTYATRNNIEVVTTNNGIVAVPVQESTITRKQVSGFGGPSQPIPSMPVGVNAQPQAPAPATTVPQAAAGRGSATPITPVPTPTPGAQTAPNSPPGSKIIGQKPLADTELRSLNAAEEGVKNMDELLKYIHDDPNVVMKASVPLVGSILAPTFKRISGDLADVVTRVRTGAALNEDEQKFYDAQLPGAKDILSQYWNFDPKAVENAINLHRQYFQRIIDEFGPRRRSRGGTATPAAPQIDPDTFNRLNSIFGGGKQ